MLKNDLTRLSKWLFRLSTGMQVCEPHKQYVKKNSEKKNGKKRKGKSVQEVETPKLPEMIAMKDVFSKSSRSVEFYSRKRAKHALLILKGKGLYANHTKKLAELEFLKSDRLETNFNVIFKALPCLPNLDCEISDDVWMSAIELTMCFVDYETMLKTNYTWDSIIETSYSIVYTIVWTIVSNAFPIEWFDNMDELQSLRDKLVDKELVESQLLAERRQNESTKSLLSKAQEELVSLRREKSSIEYSAVQPYVKDIERKNLEIEKLNKRIEELTNNSILYSSEVGDEEVEEYDISILPCRNVLFMGGTVTLINKLKIMFPDWKFVGVNDKQSDHKGSVYKCAFLYTPYLSHTSQERLESDSPDTPILFVNSTNTDRLVKEMVNQYKSIIGD